MLFYLSFVMAVAGAIVLGAATQDLDFETHQLSPLLVRSGSSLIVLGTCLWSAGACCFRL